MSARRFAASTLLSGLLYLSVSSNAYAGECTVRNVRYEVLMLGNLGASGGYATDVNEIGQVTGASSRGDDTGRAFIWDCWRGMRNIGAVAEDDFASIGQHINNRGQIVGQSFAEEDISAFIWDWRAGMRVIASGSPYSLNDHGQVTYIGSEGTLLWTEAGGSIPLRTLSGVDFREAFIDYRGDVGGYGSYSTAPDDRFLVWSPRRGVETRGPEPTDAYMNVLDGFNNRGDLLGTSFLFVGAAVPFIVDRQGSLQRLLEPRVGEYYEALAMNWSRQVVGFSFKSGDSQAQHPFLWDPRRGLQDLNMLVYGRIPSASEPRITRASSINEWGWIAGAAIAQTGPYSDAALLVPVPANDSRYRNLNRLRGPALCAALATSQLLQARTCGK